MNVSEPNKQKREVANQLLAQIIEKNTFDDALLKATNPDLSGESWNLFHLKTLQALLNEIWADEVN
jgi:hypothetical protein